MQTLTETLLNGGLGGRVFGDRQVARLLSGSAQRRYNLVNRAIHAGELVRLVRGRYVLHPDVSGSRPHAFVVAQAIRPGSFISFESALAWHDCIPEAVQVHDSVTTGRRKAEFSVPLYGDFRFNPLPLNSGQALAGVSRKTLSGGIAFIALPIRALLDILCLRKLTAEHLEKFLAELRLSEECAARITSKEVSRFRGVYRYRRMERLIDRLPRQASP